MSLNGSQPNCTMFGRLLGWYMTYIFFRGFLPRYGILPGAKFTSRSSLALSYFGSVTAWHCSSGRQPNFAALSTGRHVHSAGRPSRCSLVHILVLSFFLLLFSSPILTDGKLDVYHTSTHDMALVRIWNAGLKRAARGSLKYRTQKSPKIRHLGTVAQICRAISSQVRHISIIGTKLVKQQYLLQMCSESSSSSSSYDICSAPITD